MLQKNLFFNGGKGEHKKLLELFAAILDAKAVRDRRKSYVESKNKINYLLDQFEKGKPESIPKFLKIYEEAGLTFNPHQYIAHELSEPTKVGVMGELIGTIMGGNQVSQEVSPIENAIEIRTGNMIKEMLGYKPGTKEYQDAISFITSGGTEANLLALIIGRNISYAEKEGVVIKHLGFSGLIGAHSNGTPDLSKLRTPKFIIPESAHYSLDKIANIIGLGEHNILKVRSDENFRIDTEHLEKILHDLDLKKEKPVAIMLVFGSTEIGAVDNLSECFAIIQNFTARNNERIWTHLDGALGMPAILTNKFAHLRNILPAFDSITFDPHKLLWTPYNAGSITFKNKQDLHSISTDASYIDTELTNIQEFKKKLDDHLGGVKIIGSQSTGGIISTYLTLKTFKFDGVSSTVQHLLDLTQYLSDKLQSLKLSEGIIEVLNPHPDLNLLVFRYLPNGDREISREAYFTGGVDNKQRDEISFANKQIYNFFKKDSTSQLISKVKLATAEIDALRVCIMNPVLMTEDLDRFVENLRKVVEKKIIRGDNE